MKMTEETFMPEAREYAAQCWHSEETKGLEMNAALAEVVAQKIAEWMYNAALFSLNANLYRELIDQCADHLGPEAYTADDGTVMEDPVRLKIPELVKNLATSAKVSESRILIPGVLR